MPYFFETSVLELKPLQMQLVGRHGICFIFYDAQHDLIGNNG